MGFKIVGKLVGKIKTAPTKETNGDRVSYSFPVNTTEPWYDRKNKKQTFQPTTVWVRVRGDLSPKMLDRMKEGMGIIVEGQVERSIYTKDGSPVKYQKGDRTGDFMYNTYLNASSFDIDFPPLTTGDAEEPEAVNAGASSSSSDGDRPNWL